MVETTGTVVWAAGVLTTVLVVRVLSQLFQTEEVAAADEELDELEEVLEEDEDEDDEEEEVVEVTDEPQLAPFWTENCVESVSIMISIVRH